MNKVQPTHPTRQRDPAPIVNNTVPVLHNNRGKVRLSKPARPSGSMIDADAYDEMIDVDAFYFGEGLPRVRRYCCSRNRSSPRANAVVDSE